MSTLIQPLSESQISKTRDPHSAILHTASQAPRILALSSKYNRMSSSLAASSSSPISSSTLSTLLSLPLTLLNPESHELWTAHEEIVLACLRTGDEESARKAANALTQRFGADNERVMALRGQCDEVAAGDDEGKLRKVLEGYERALSERPENLPIRKRKIALLKSMGRIQRAVEELVALLDIYAVDSEAWAELAELYVEQGCYGQAIFCLEEVLLIAPNAWNIHARLGEVEYMSAKAGGSNSSNANSGGKDYNGDAATLLTISDSMRRFCRSVELCDDYLRGFYGLKITTKHILDIYEKSPKLESFSPATMAVTTADDDTVAPLPPPVKKHVERLNELATAKLAEIVRRAGARAGREKGWEGYEWGELKAARELLDG